MCVGVYGDLKLGQIVACLFFYFYFTVEAALMVRQVYNILELLKLMLVI